MNWHNNDGTLKIGKIWLSRSMFLFKIVSVSEYVLLLNSFDYNICNFLENFNVDTGRGLGRTHLCDLLRQMAWCWRIKRPMSTKQSEAVFLRLFSSWRLLLLLKGSQSPRGHSLLASVWSWSFFFGGSKLIEF